MDITTLLIPVGGLLLYKAAAPSAPVAAADLTPPAGPPAVLPGSPRVQAYQQQLVQALAKYQQAKDGGQDLPSAGSVLLQTCDVVIQMAQTDLVAGRILQLDFDGLSGAVVAIRAKVMAETGLQPAGQQTPPASAAPVPDSQPSPTYPSSVRSDPGYEMVPDYGSSAPAPSQTTAQAPASTSSAPALPPIVAVAPPPAAIPAPVSTTSAPASARDSSARMKAYQKQLLATVLVNPKIRDAAIQAILVLIRTDHQNRLLNDTDFAALQRTLKLFKITL